MPDPVPNIRDDGKSRMIDSSAPFVIVCCLKGFAACHRLRDVQDPGGNQKVNKKAVCDLCRGFQHVVVMADDEDPITSLWRSKTDPYI